MCSSLSDAQNFDTDVVVDHPDTMSRFYLPGPETSPHNRELMLSVLRDEWDGSPTRHNQVDAEWISRLSLHLDLLIDMRVDHVREWISSNLARFKTGHANIEALRRTFETAIIDLRANVQLCRMKCDSCHLLCLRGRLHDHGPEEPHHCQTSHRCVHTCDFCESDSEEKTCGFT